jgi:hypothetical protein
MLPNWSKGFCEGLPLTRNIKAIFLRSNIILTIYKTELFHVIPKTSFSRRICRSNAFNLSQFKLPLDLDGFSAIAVVFLSGDVHGLPQPE